MSLDSVELAKAYPKHNIAHPFDPLAHDELETAVRIVQTCGQFRTGMRFVMLQAKEPPKSFMAGFRSGQSFERLVDVLMIDTTTTRAIDAIVSLSKGEVVSWAIAEDKGQPMIIPDEFVEMTIICMQDERVARALEKRGLDIAERGLVCIDPLSAGYFSEDEDPSRRLLRGMFLMRKESNDNIYAHPIEGLTALVDMNAQRVVEVIDMGVVPVPQTMRNYERQYIKKMREPLKPIVITQPEGVNYTVDGWAVRWQRWSFHMSFNAREGLVLHDIRYDDPFTGKVRPICYRASISEMTVPYCDVTSTNGMKNAFDVGEYGLGVLTNSLSLGCDCLGEIRYFDFDFVNAYGEIESIPNAICMHEEDDSIMWKHTDLRTEKVENRRSTKFVVSFIATVGNYEYGFYWNFRLDGSVELETKANGLMQTGAVLPGETTRHGTMMEEGLYAPNHQHFFCARLDMNLDGDKNRVVEVNSVADPTGPTNPKGNAFYTKTTVFETEQEAKRNHDYRSARTWVVQNPNSLNRMGTPVGYRIEPMEIGQPYFNADSAIANRAGYLNHHLWVTPFREDELFAAGRFPNQNPGPDGLPVWTAQNRPINNEDIVLWYVFCHHHVARLEDWPVMPNAKLGFKLKPTNFFDFNPALDLPPAFADKCGPGKAHCGHGKSDGQDGARAYVPQRLTRLMRRTMRREKLIAEAEGRLEQEKVERKDGPKSKH